MTGNGNCFVEWKEEFVSQERGNRVVNYFLKDSSGEAILAVVGTERSVRHMFYVVAEEFVRFYGAQLSMHAGYKWRSRREVVDWLTSMLSKQHLQRDRSKSPIHDLPQASGSLECPINGVSASEFQPPDKMGHLSRLINGQSSDIVWSGIAWTCGKQLKHYPAFGRNGTTISIQSFVFVMAKGQNHYVAYLEDMYEDKRGQRKVKVRWFHHNQEVKGVISVRNPHPKEVFITPHSQVISAECVDGPATVLTLEHFEKCLVAFPNALLARVHLCTRQFRSNKLKPFDLAKLHGYYDQPIISLLNSNTLQETNTFGHGVTGDKDDITAGENAMLGTKRARRGKGSKRFLTDNTGVGTDRGFRLRTCKPPYKKLKYGLSSMGVLSVKNVDCEPRCSSVCKADARIELLCQDSGIRGCWFRCLVLQVSRKQVKVQYDDLQDEDGHGNLQEWIPIFKVAKPDKLGMRYPGRPTIRPAPLDKEEDFSIDIGTAVDAWWSDGWWEGVVIGIDNSGADNLKVYLPGESVLLNSLKKDLRISRDWVGDQWVDIAAKPDILSLISDAITPESEVPFSSIIAQDVNSDGLDALTEVPVSTNFDTVKDEKSNLAALACSDPLPDEMDCVDEKIPLSLEQGIGQGVDQVDARGDQVQEAQGSGEHEDNDDNNDSGGKVDPIVFETSGHDCRNTEVLVVVAA